MSNVTNQHNKAWQEPKDMENDNSLSVTYAINMKMNDRSQSRVSNFNVYTDADNRKRDKKQRREIAAVRKRKMLGASGLKISGSGFLLSANEVDVFFFIL